MLKINLLMNKIYVIFLIVMQDVVSYIWPNATLELHWHPIG